MLGEYTGILIVSPDDKHRRQMIEAFDMPAHYALMYYAFTGYRYRTIIVFEPEHKSTTELAKYKTAMSELWCRLDHKGKLLVL